MARWKGALALIAAMGVIVALLFATGVLRLRSGASTQTADPTAEAGVAPPAQEDHGLEDLGYLAVEPRPADKEKRGVTRHDREKASGGLVLWNYCGWGPGLGRASLDEPYGETHLMDLGGKILRTWDSDVFGPQKHGRSISRLLPDGSVIINVADTGIARLDWDGKVMWKLEGGYHHDHTADDKGNIFTLIEREHEFIIKDEPHLILDHGIQQISVAGKVVKTWWMSESLAENGAFLRRAARAANRRNRDAIHANSIELLRAHPEGLWKEGDFLTSLRNLELVVVLSRKKGKILWEWGRGRLQQQHSPTQAPDGKILVFDNGSRRKWSRIVEVDPTKSKIEWEYKGPEDDPFYSFTRGVVQQLENGNIFVVSSNAGRMFELTRDKDIVWEYYSSESFRKKRIPIRAVRLEGALLESIEKLLP